MTITPPVPFRVVRNVYAFGDAPMVWLHDVEGQVPLGWAAFSEVEESLRKSAISLGANAVIGVRVSFAEPKETEHPMVAFWETLKFLFGRGANQKATVFAYGTAVEIAE